MAKSVETTKDMDIRIIQAPVTTKIIDLRAIQATALTNGMETKTTAITIRRRWRR